MNRRTKTSTVLLALVLLAVASAASAQIQVFSTGQYGTPETISLAPAGFGAFGGRYFIPDARLGVIWTVPSTGGPPVKFVEGASSTGGLFLPSGWSSSSGNYLIASSPLRVYDAAGNFSVFDPTESLFTTPLIAPAGFGPFGGHLFVSDQNFGQIWRADPAGGGLTIFKDLNTPPDLDSPFGLEFTPAGFGAFGNRLMVSDTDGGTIEALSPDGTGSVFATIPLAEGQFGLRQMLMTPEDFLLPSLGIPGHLLLVSITGSGQGGGTQGALVALDSTGTIVAHLKEGSVLQKFDPRGMVFTADGHLLISDTSDPIYLASAADFVAGGAARSLTALSPAHLFVGLKNSDDQGTQFDVQVEFLRNGTPVASGGKRCVTGLTRSPNLASEVVVSFAPFDPVTVTAGDVLSLRASARIGTNSDGSKCAGPGGSHNSALGVRLYYDSASRASRFDVTTAPNASGDLYLRSDGGACGDAQSGGVTTRYLDGAAPVAGNAKCKDSGVVNFAGGNPFSVIGTWSLAPLP